MITLRRATLADSPLLLRWRNDPEVLCGQRPATDAERDRWMIHALQDKRWHLYIAQREVDQSYQLPDLASPVGMGCLAETPLHVAVVTYLAAPECREVGGQILAALCAEALKLGCRALRAEVMRENVVSIQALLSAGFEFSPVEVLTLEKGLK